MIELATIHQDYYIKTNMKPFESINRAYNEVFQPQRLSVGLVVPIEPYPNHPVPRMEQHLTRIKMAEALGFKSIWLRDVPFHVPSFGDAGQTFDPFTYLGFIAGQTSEIGLGIASIALPLHHPVHVAKSVATIDQLSGGRIILGVASGDRYDEYPAMGIAYEKRGELFREAFQYIRNAQKTFPKFESATYGSLKGHIDILPKAKNHKIPMLITGHSRQSLDWNAQHGDGWMYYPRNIQQQQTSIQQWRSLIPDAEYDKPFMQPLYIDLMDDDDFIPQPIHLGLRIGAKHLRDYFRFLEQIGVNHIAINLRFNSNPIEQTLEALSNKILPHFHQQKENIHT